MGPWREQEAPEGGVGVWSQPLGTQAQVKVQLEKFHCPMGAKEELLGPGHHQGSRRATQGAEEKDKWVWQRRLTVHKILVVSYAQSVYMHPRLTRQGAPRTN